MVLDGRCLRLLKPNLLVRYSKHAIGLLVVGLILNLLLTVQRLHEEIDRLRAENARLMAANAEDSTILSETYKDAELIHGKAYRTEMDMPRFSMFTSEWIYLIEPGLGKRVVERLFGSKKEDYLQVVAAGNSRLQSNPEIKGALSFMFGIVRFLPRDGMHYELVYKEKRTNGDIFIKKMIFLRPFNRLGLIQSGNSIFANSFNIYSPTVHFVMTATADHMPKVLTFLENHFVMLGKNSSPTMKYNLTLVMFLDEKTSVEQIRDMVHAKLDQLNYHLTVNVVPVQGTQASNFSRALGLHSGIVDIFKRSRGEDPLVFTTDVDVVVTPLFLNRCRLHAERGRRVYFPLVFSLYNPDIVYPLFLNRTVPTSVKERLNIHDETGWWRDFGYGMGCFYKSDYDSVGGFGTKLQLRGWGYEDVGLFRKFVQSKLLVVRAVDPGVFHIYHKKECDAGDIGNARYRSCIASRAYNEASHSQLGVLCLKNGTELV